MKRTNKRNKNTITLKDQNQKLQDFLIEFKTEVENLKSEINLLKKL